VPTSALPASIPVRHLPDGAWLAPGFIDIQVNGGGDVLFNDMPTPEGIAAIVTAHRRFGTTSLMPTILTDSEDKMRQALSAVQALVGVDAGVLGIHFEGPFLSPDKAGVHDPRWIRSPRSADVELLTSLQGGVTLLTLAPERVPPGFIAQLAGADVRVSLGHSMATYAQTRLALSQGLTGFTHLFNAMRPLASREPGPIAAALEEPGAWFGIIVDGEHVAPAMLRLALRGEGRPMLVTALWAGNYRAQWSLHDGRWHTGRHASRYGECGAQHCASARAAARRGVASRIGGSRRLPRHRGPARPYRSRVSRRHGGARSRRGPGIGELGRRRGHAVPEW
jgi:N-acetylglucosamine-6-phosphate deacetylase